jgi:VWFA-related protein
MTALFDAIAMSLITERQANRRQMAIVFTDGQDNVSVLDDATVIEVARRSEAAIFGVAITSGLARAPRQAAHADMFRVLADLTGGRFTVLQRDQDLGSSFSQAFADFRTSYVLRYVLSGVPRRGWHALTVTVKRPGAYDVRARKGYQG